MKYISIPLFILSFMLGMVYIYLSNPPQRSILIYPTVDNNNNFQYKDKADQCFDLSAKLVDCTNSAKNIPIQ